MAAGSARSRRPRRSRKRSPTSGRGDPMTGTISAHIRRNVVGYLALFVALGGTAWATNGPLQGRNTVGSADILNGEVKAPDIGPSSVASADIKDAPSGSDAVDADLLDGFDSGDFAPAADVTVADRVKIDDPTPGDLGGAEVD